MAEIILCSHCGDKKTGGKGKFCQFCDTKEKRAEMDANNKNIWDNTRQGINGYEKFKNEKLKEYECKYCGKEK